ncbi:hypothetical protein TWF481_010412 [Arthrobotrys musiformis]|uniref:Protein kinase domain-containing protein n=1 Tax=Arthrobotrys musiformis TaxID=47236 RepID=A0AAV9W1U3_9PEZI
MDLDELSNRYTRWPGWGGASISQRLPIRPLSLLTPTSPPSPQNTGEGLNSNTQSSEGLANPDKRGITLAAASNQPHPQPPISGFLNVFQAGKVSLCLKRNGKVAALRVATREQFSEIQALIRSSHKNVIQIIGYIQHPKVNYIQHEYLEIALNEIIGCPILFPEPQIGYICHEVLSALEFLDSVGLEHTKIESSRVLLSQPNTVKVGDALSIRRKNLPSEASQISFPAAGVGGIALDMMENGILSNNGDRAAALTHPQHWTASASDFIRNTSCSAVRLLLQHPFVNPSPNPNLTEAIIMGITCAQRMWTPHDE